MASNYVTNYNNTSFANLVLAAIAGAQGWEDIENYGLSKQQWLEKFLELPNGIQAR